MTYSIVYSSKTGNTKMLADAILQTLEEKDCMYCGKPDAQALQADRIYVGFWTDKGRCNEEIAQFLKTIETQAVFLFGTAGFGQDPEYFSEILFQTQKCLKNPNCVIGTYMCQGKMPMSVRHRYESMPNIANKQKMLDNFDQALQHPNDQDLENLKRIIK